MKVSLILIVQLCSLIGCASSHKCPNGTKEKIVKNAEKKDTVYLCVDDNGKISGPILVRDQEGRKRGEGYGKNNKKNGMFRSWHENGQLQSRGQFKNNLKHGVFEYWHENGQLLNRITYGDGKIVKHEPTNDEGAPCIWDEKGEVVCASPNASLPDIGIW